MISLQSGSERLQRGARLPSAKNYDKKIEADFNSGSQIRNSYISLVMFLVISLVM